MVGLGVSLSCLRSQNHGKKYTGDMNMRFLIFGECGNCVKLKKEYDADHLQWQADGLKMLDEITSLKEGKEEVVVKPKVVEVVKPKAVVS